MFENCEGCIHLMKAAHEDPCKDCIRSPCLRLYKKSVPKGLLRGRKMNYSSFSEYPEECEDCEGKRFYPGCKQFCILDFDKEVDIDE